MNRNEILVVLALIVFAAFVLTGAYKIGRWIARPAPPIADYEYCKDYRYVEVRSGRHIHAGNCNADGKIRILYRNTSNTTKK